MSLSTIFMPCNYSGFFNPDFAAKWGVTDFDWSNAKQLWANTKPMKCEEMLLEQAEVVKQLNPHMRVFVYRNLVKALPWYSQVREKILDPAYAGWFLKFAHGVNGTYHQPQCTKEKCSGFYHDQDQTPEHPSGDGSCVDECDCGDGLPCGEYLWDHRNESLREWLIESFVLGTEGLGDPSIDGVFLDDGWSNTSQPAASWWPKEGYCDADVIGGPSEEYRNCTLDMGLKQQDTTDITAEWRKTTELVQQAIVERGGYNWQMLSTTSGAPPRGDVDGCMAFFRSECGPDAPKARHNAAWMLEFTNPKSLPLEAVTQDLASFLLVRGDFAWIGYGWKGCTSGAATAESMYPRPEELDVDYGTPKGECEESAPGVFTRQWTKAQVSFNCSSWSAEIKSD
mmetsp:Transcript_18552/g.44482  ORF Transcript_18552/g.44482 Transcript_18552/m.44482 type:complete len:396 (-) Transcript_18552:25-1212(-)